MNETRPPAKKGRSTRDDEATLVITALLAESRSFVLRLGRHKVEIGLGGCAREIEPAPL